MINKKPIPKILDYNNIIKCKLSMAYSIQEKLKFGDIYELNMKIPYYLYDSYSNLVLDNNNKPVINYNLEYIKNEMIIDFNNNLYLIKNISPIRDSSNKKYIEVYCQQKSIELAYKNIAHLDMSPPLYDPVYATTAIDNILTAKSEIDYGDIQSATSTTIELESSASAVNDYYNGKRISITDGLGQGQNRRITDYDGTTKKVTISPALTIIPNTTSVYRIHNSKYSVGNVDSSFLNDGSDIYRSYLFDGVNALECLNQVAQKLSGYLQYRFVYDETYNEFINYVDLVKANNYNNVEIAYKKNLKYIKKESDTTENIYTRVFPYGKDNLTINNVNTTSRSDSGITYNDHIDGQPYIENYQYYLALGYDIDFCRENFINDFELNDDTYVDEDDLFSDAKDLLEKVSVPKNTYRVDIVDKSILIGYEYEEINIGDTIRVRDGDLNTDINTLVSAITTNYDNPQRPSLELTNAIDNLGGFIYQIIKNSKGYTDLNKVYGKSTTYIVADKATSKNWRYADFIVDEKNTLPNILNKICEGFAVTGGKVILLDGTYLIDRMVNISNTENITVEGQGSSTIIKISDSADKSTFFSLVRFGVNEHVTFKNLVLDGNSANSTYLERGLRIDSGAFNTITNIIIKNVNKTGGIGIEILDGDDFIISDCAIDNIEGEGISVISTQRATLRNITISNCKYHGLVEKNTCSDILYDNIFITTCDTIGIELNGINSKLSNSTIKDCVTGVQTYGDGQKIMNSTIKDNSGQGIFNNGCNDLIINNNTIANNYGYGLWCSNDTNSLITNNIIIDSGNEGILMGGSENTKINNNFLSGNDTRGNDRSIALVSGTNCEIQANKIRSSTCEDGIAIIGCSYTLVINNDLIDGYTINSVYISSSTDTLTTSQNRG